MSSVGCQSLKSLLVCIEQGGKALIISPEEDDEEGYGYAINEVRKIFVHHLVFHSILLCKNVKHSPDFPLWLAVQPVPGPGVVEIATCSHGCVHEICLLTAFGSQPLGQCR